MSRASRGNVHVLLLATSMRYRYLIVSPGQPELVEAATGLVHAVCGRVARIVLVGIEVIELGENDGIVGDAAARDPSVTSQTPLRSIGRAILTVGRSFPQEHDFAHVMEQPRENHPVGMPVQSNALRGLQ